MSSNKTIDSPREIKWAGWKKILNRVYIRIDEDNVAIVSAGVAFYAFLAIFPALMTLISIYGLALDPELAERQIALLADLMPEEAFSIIEAQIDNLLRTSSTALTWGTALGILITLWSSNQGTKSLFVGLDIAYRTTNKRGFIKQTAFTLLFTFVSIIILVVSMIFIVVFPVVVQAVGLPGDIEGLISWLRWPLLAVFVVSGVGAIYKYAPHRETPAFKWVVIGAAVATLLWLIASFGFSFYVSNIGDYGEMYGSISAVVIMLLWLFITSFIILLGGELNSATEAYTAREMGETD